MDHYVSLINLLIAAGARNVTNDWTKIYCQKCDFTTSRNLSGAHFDESYLSRANFAHIDLHGATFRSADLGGTIFFASDLSKADLSWTLFDDSGAKQNASRIRYSKFPILECATLNGADLSNTPLGEVTRRLYGREQQGLPAVELRMPRMISVKFNSNTKLTTLGMRFSFTADDAFFAALTPADQQALRSAFNTEPFDWPSTLIANFPFYANDVLPVDEIHITEFPPANRAPQVDGAPIRIDYITTNRFLVLGERAGWIADWLKPLFDIAFGQPIWKALPITSEILSTPQRSVSGNTWRAKGNNYPPPSGLCSSPVPRGDYELNVFADEQTLYGSPEISGHECVFDFRPSSRRQL